MAELFTFQLSVYFSNKQPTINTEVTQQWYND